MRGYYTSRQAAAAIGISLTQFRKLCLDEEYDFPKHRLHNNTYYYAMQATNNWIKQDHTIFISKGKRRDPSQYDSKGWDNSLAVLFHRLLPPIRLNKTCNSLKML
jgi:hypothetical protein